MAGLGGLLDYRAAMMPGVSTFLSFSRWDIRPDPGMARTSYGRQGLDSPEHEDCGSTEISGWFGRRKVMVLDDLPSGIQLWLVYTEVWRIG